jgi:hypothetical protein
MPGTCSTLNFSKALRIAPWGHKVPQEHVSQYTSGTTAPIRPVLFAKWSENYSKHSCRFRIIYFEGGHALQRRQRLNWLWAYLFCGALLGGPIKKKLRSRLLRSCSDLSSDFQVPGIFPYPKQTWLPIPLDLHIQIHWSHCHSCTCDPNRSVLFAKWSENYSKHFSLFRIFYSEVERALQRPRHLNHSICSVILWGTFGWSPQDETLP